MNVKALHRSDRWIGVPICFVLSVVRAIFGGLRSSFSAQPRNILFVKLAEQGSTVLAYPALRRAAEMVGGENVYFLLFEDNRFILDELGIIPVQNVITISVENVTKFFVSMFRALWRVRR